MFDVICKIINNTGTKITVRTSISSALKPVDTVLSNGQMLTLFEQQEVTDIVLISGEQKAHKSKRKKAQKQKKESTKA